jgi:hypothetical protein
MSFPQASGRRVTHMGFSWENMNDRDVLEDLGVDSRIILKIILNALEAKA